MVSTFVLIPSILPNPAILFLQLQLLLPVGLCHRVPGDERY